MGQPQRAAAPRETRTPACIRGRRGLEGRCGTIPRYSWINGPANSPQTSACPTLVSDMLQAETIASARASDGTEFELVRRDEEWMVRVGGMVLMSSRMHHSEEALAARALERAPRATSVLVGGLGLGFTLRAVLDRVSEDTKVTVAELLPSLVDWNREHVAALAGRPLEDRRCEVVVGDVFALIQRSRAAFDVILLDVDNGPVALSYAKNQRLYSDHGVRACAMALRPHGVLAVWSSGPSARFERRLAGAGFKVEALRESARKGSRGTHVVFLAEWGADKPAARPLRQARNRTAARK